MKNIRSGWIVTFAAVAAVCTLGSRPAEATIQGDFEEPGEIASGVGNIRGWAFTDVEGASILSPIDVLIDGEKSYEVPCCSARGDVADLVKGAPLSTGYGGAFNYALLDPGPHEITIVVKSTAGEMRTFSKKIKTVRIGDLTFMQRLRFTEDSACTFRNNSPGNDNAGFICTNLLAEVKEGPPTLCRGALEITWDKSTQSFKVTSDCNSGCENDADCDDGLFCNGVESCDTETGLCVAVSSCPPFVDGCVIRGGQCDEETDSCLDVPDDAICDDGVFCNGVESCNAATGDCVAVSACPPSPDGCVTRAGACDEETDTCLDVPDDASCDDGLFCNGVESCDPTTGACVAVSACPPFQDGCVTRAGACDEATDSCLDVPDDALCDDGVFCNGIESCDPVGGGCVAVSACPPTFPMGCVTPGAICDEATDSCLDELDDDQCLAGGVCQPDGSCD